MKPNQGRYLPYLLVGPLLLLCFSMTALAHPLGLPPLPVPEDNPQSPAKIKLGDRLFHDTRFSKTGKVSCSTCHEREKAFTDQKVVSQGIDDLKGTRNAPTVINAAYMETQFWDGREPSLEEQSTQPFVNPVEMGLEDHEPILKMIREDPSYVASFKEVFGVTSDEITIEKVKQAIGSFERTIISGDSPFDRYQYGNDKSAMSPAAIRGLEIFVNQGRCVSCHIIEQTQALFTDTKFHNIGVGFQRMENREEELVKAFVKSRKEGKSVDVTVLTKENVSELGRFAVSDQLQDMGSFKTPTLRNVAVTAPYMHDGSVQTLEETVQFYNNGGRLKDTDPLSPFLDGGIRPLDLTEEQQADLVAFLESLTSPEFVKSAKTEKSK